MKRPTPPAWADALLEWYCSKNYIDEVQGDLHEWFYRRIKKQGIGRAKLLYPLDVIRFVRSYRIKSIQEFNSDSNHRALLKNYIVTSWRSLSKYKVFSTINMLGLAAGMSAFLLISLYVQYERSYDQFHEKKDDLYRVQLDRYNNGELTTQWAAGCAAIGPALKEHFGEVAEFVNMRLGDAVLSFEDKIFREENAYFASEAFFQLFSIPLLQGQDSLALKGPFMVVLSESAAKKYFGNESAVGKTIRGNGHHDFEVTGVFQDIPKNSHFEADILFSFETLVTFMGEGVHTEWNWDGFYTYLLLHEGVDALDFESKFPDFVQKQIGEELEATNTFAEFHLQPITDIHLTSDYMMEFKPNGDGEATNFLFIISIFIILIAWVNYINLATARSMDRSREVGIRKVMGSMRGQLMKQFLVESFILNLLALLLSLLIVFFVLPYFNQLSGRQLVLDLTDPVLWITLLTILIIGGLFSGLYPAFVISGFHPVTILKGKFINSTKGNYLRKGLVIFQFLASLVLMVGTLTVFQQLHYMRSQELGVNIDHTLIVRGPSVRDSLYSDQFNGFKQSLSAHAEIKAITASSAVPGSPPSWNAGGIRLLEQDATESNQYRIIGMDHDFINAYRLEVLAGRGFEEERVNDQSTAVLLNESATRLMGFSTIQEALQREILFWGDTFKIVGVLENYHQESLKKSFEPLIFRLMPNISSYYSIKVNTNNINQTIEQVEQRWAEIFPGNPFNYFFLDDHYDQQYRAEIQFGKVFGLFASLAIFIACLGLFGLASYITARRSKEIGIRKVLGATIMDVIALLSKNFVQLIFLAIILAIPISWVVMRDWLNGFAYQIALSWWLFFIPGIALMGIAIITVSLQTLKIGLLNPVDSLKQE